MVSRNPFKEQSSYTLRKKLLPWTLYALLLTILLLHLRFSSTQHLPSKTQIIITAPSSQEKTSSSNIEIQYCDYSEGKWVHDKLGPLYNGTSCNTIKDGQNCMNHGRPDKGYLYWKWKPKYCSLPRFDPITFLQLLTNKHMAFVGDSMARNQIESLICMLSTASKPVLIQENGDDNKFRKWHFSSYNANLSIYWSPFLVKGIEKNGDAKYNKLYLDSVSESWGNDINQMDMLVLSVGHWFLHPALYYYRDKVLGCHYCHKYQNYTEIEFFDVLKTALNTTLKTIIERKGSKGDEFDVFVTTFSPHHFEGEWDKFGACPKTKPYKESEKKLQGMDADMRRVEIEEVTAAKEKIKVFDNLRLAAVDVSKLALLRPDGHPGPYMYPFPFANGIGERVQNDCVHWCLPGPIDTWNQILLDLLKRRRRWHSNTER